MLKAHFRQVTPWTVEVRFFTGDDSYEDRSMWVGSCNLHFHGLGVEASMLKLDGCVLLQGIRLMRDYLKGRGFKKYRYEHNGLYHTRRII